MTTFLKVTFSIYCKASKRYTEECVFNEFTANHINKTNIMNVKLCCIYFSNLFYVA